MLARLALVALFLNVQLCVAVCSTAKVRSWWRGRAEAAAVRNDSAALHIVQELMSVCALKTVVQVSSVEHVRDVKFSQHADTRLIVINEHLPKDVVAADVYLSSLKFSEPSAYRLLFVSQARWVVVHLHGGGARHNAMFVDEVARSYPQFELVASLSATDAHYHIFRRLRIIASFTSFGARAPAIAPMLESLMRQTLMPDEIRCYSEVPLAEFGAKVERLLDSPVVTLHRADARLRSYKKFLPVLEDEWGRDDTVILIFDDDWQYRPTLVFELLERHRSTGGIVVDRGRQISTGSYLSWKMGMSDAQYPHRTLILGGSGTLLPLARFGADAILNFQAAHQLAATADDMWLTIHAILQGVPVSELSRTHSHPFAFGVKLPGPALWETNKHANDKIWQLLLDYGNKTHGVDVLARAFTKSASPA